jgi:hypothetical protein
MISEDVARRTAVMVGRGVERVTGVVVDTIEDRTLRMLEQFARIVGPGTQGSGVVVRAIGDIRTTTAPWPRGLGRLTAGAVYFGIRFGGIAVRSARQVLRESGRLLDTDVTLSGPTR